jgi:amphi-Trp domain-containing protein
MANETPPVTADSKKSNEETERKLIRSGRDFEQEYRVSAAEAGAFLVKLGEQLQSGDELTLRTDEWELPFAFGEPVELEIEYEGLGEPELEIEIEIPGQTDEDAPDII